MSRKLGGENRLYLYDDDGDVHSYDPGDTVPDWAVKKVDNPDVWATDSDDEDDNDEVKPYAKWKKADLEAEVASRNEGREDDALIVVGGTGKVADLAEALDADDAAEADADNE